MATPSRSASNCVWPSNQSASRPLPPAATDPADTVSLRSHALLQVIPLARVLRAATDGDELAEFNEPFEPRLRGTGGALDGGGDLAGGRARFAPQEFHNGGVELVAFRLGDALATEGDAEAAADFLQFRLGQPGGAARGGHALDATAPLLDESQFVKDAADNAVAELGDAASDVLHGQSGWQVAGIFDLDAVTEDGETDG